MRALLSKRPWLTVLPSAPGTPLRTKTRIQDDFIRQYYPSSHDIQDPMFYPDIWRDIEEPILDGEGNDTGRTTHNTYVEKVPRYSFAYQQLITLKHLVHLCGNDIQFDLNTDTANKETERDMKLFMDGWQGKNMEYAFYEFAKSVKITGDAAFVAYLEGGEFGWETLSFFKGDRLYPHYGRNGKLTVFARAYKEYAEDGTATERLEVWDRTCLHRLHRATEAEDSPATLIFGSGPDARYLDGYAYDDPELGAIPHGFTRVPVEYYRNENGPCWSPSQDSIDEYEIGFSQMAHNNKAFGEPIMYLKGDNVEANHDMNGTIKTIAMGPDDSAGYLSAQSASESFMRELSELHDRIFEQSFVVTPPELKSGDLPAAALKILYSPAVERGMTDAQEYTPALNGITYLFAYGYGVEMRKSLAFVNLPLRPWIKPYIHQNESAIMSDLAMGVQNGFVSKRTASERASFYTVGTERERLAAEAKEAESADILAQFEAQKFGSEQ